MGFFISNKQEKKNPNLIKIKISCLMQVFLSANIGYNFYLIRDILDFGNQGKQTLYMTTTINIDLS